MSPPGTCHRFGPFTLDTRERLLLRDGLAVPLPPKAFDLLALLVEHHGRLLTKEELFTGVWPDTVVEESNLSYTVFAVRKALGDDAQGRGYIETVPKRGYRFTHPVIAAAGTAMAGEADPLSGTPLSESSPPAPQDVSRPMRAGYPWAPWSVTAVCLAALIALSLVHFRGLPPVAAVRFELPLPIQPAEYLPFAISPDGRYLAFSGAAADGIMRVWVRSMDALAVRAVAGTEYVAPAPLFWSPDSRFIAFTAGGQLEKVSVSGGVPQKVCDLPELAVGGAWNRDDVIVVGNPAGGLIRCTATGGKATPITIPDRSAKEMHLLPWFLPDGRHLLYVRISRIAPEKSGVYVGTLDVKPEDQRTDRLIGTGFGAAFLPSADSTPGQIVFARDGALLAQAFDDRTLQLVGDAIRVAEPVGSYLDAASFTVSTNGVLVYRAPESDFQLTWFDRTGRALGHLGEPGKYDGVALAPDGSRAVAVKLAPRNTVDQDMWLFDVSRETTPRRMTFDAILERSPVWRPDNSGFVFSVGGGLPSIYETAVVDGGAPRLLLDVGDSKATTSVSPDGRWLLYTTSPGLTRTDIWVLPLAESPATPSQLIRREFDQGQAQFSPDGHWIAYVSNESGPSYVFVTPFLTDARTGAVSAGESHPVSKGGGTAPRWRRDGKELFYLTGDGTVMGVTIDTSRGFQAGTPRPLFQAAGALPDWGVTADGARFLFAVPVGHAAPPPFEVILNWRPPSR